MYVEVHPNSLFTKKQESEGASVCVATAETDFNGSLMLTDLEPDTRTTTGCGSRRGPEAFSRYRRREWGTFTTLCRPSPPGEDQLHRERRCGRPGILPETLRPADSIFASMQALKPDSSWLTANWFTRDAACTADGPDGPAVGRTIPGDFKSIAARPWKGPHRASLGHFAGMALKRTPIRTAGVLQTSPDDVPVGRSRGDQRLRRNCPTGTPPRSVARLPNITDAGLRTFLAYSR